MERLKPSTSRAVETLAGELTKVADDIEPARPFLATIYRELAESLLSSLSVPEEPFRLKLPVGVTTKKTESHITLYPPHFDPQKYYNRLTKRAS